MVDASGFRGVIEFLDKIGVYDIILPFLLVFTIVFAILEKTKVFGLEKAADGKEYTRKNLNSIVAFVTAFIVIASSKLVATINIVMGNVVLLLILAICFLMLVGTFHTGDKEFSFKETSPWVQFLTFLMFIGITLIFLNALGWLEFIYQLFTSFDAQWAASIIFFIIILGFIIFITWDTKPSAEAHK